jgi:OmpA family
MTPVERLRLAASICLVGGAVDVAVLAGWAWPRALSELEGRNRRAASMAVVTTHPATAVVEPAPPPPVPADAVIPPLPAESPPATSDRGSDDDSGRASGAASGAASAEAVTGPSSVGVILFRTRAGSRWIDPDKSFQRIVELAERDPNLVLAIDGYADQGTDRRDSKKLSLLRARKIATALQSAGVAADRMIVRGHAGSRSRVRGLGRGTLRSARRVEIRVHPREAP